jgi:hypothetical protein
VSDSRGGWVALRRGGLRQGALVSGEADLTEDAGVVKVPCGNCGYVALFDAETVGIRGMWDKGRDL